MVKKIIYKGKVTGVRLFLQDGTITVAHHNVSLSIEAPRDQIAKSGFTLGTEVKITITHIGG